MEGEIPPSPKRTCQSQLFDKEVHPGLAVLVDEHHKQHCRIAQDDGEEQDPQHNKLLRLKERKWKPDCGHISLNT